MPRSPPTGFRRSIRLVDRQSSLVARKKGNTQIFCDARPLHSCAATLGPLAGTSNLRRAPTITSVGKEVEPRCGRYGASLCSFRFLTSPRGPGQGSTKHVAKTFKVMSDTQSRSGDIIPVPRSQNCLSRRELTDLLEIRVAVAASGGLPAASPAAGARSSHRAEEPRVALLAPAAWLPLQEEGPRVALSRQAERRRRVHPPPTTQTTAEGVGVEPVATRTHLLGTRWRDLSVCSHCAADARRSVDPARDAAVAHGGLCRPCRDNCLSIPAIGLGHCQVKRRCRRTSSRVRSERRGKVNDSQDERDMGRFGVGSRRLR